MQLFCSEMLLILAVEIRQRQKSILFEFATAVCFNGGWWRLKGVLCCKAGKGENGLSTVCVLPVCTLNDKCRCDFHFRITSFACFLTRETLEPFSFITPLYPRDQSKFHFVRLTHCLNCLFHDLETPRLDFFLGLFALKTNIRVR